MHLRPLRHWNRGMIQPLLIFLSLISWELYKLIPRMRLAQCVRRTPMATMQSQVVRSVAVALRGQTGTCPAGMYSRVKICLNRHSS